MTSFQFVVDMAGKDGARHLLGLCLKEIEEMKTRADKADKTGDRPDNQADSPENADNSK